MWKYRGDERPPFADQPGPEQESVWDYPRPPALQVRSSLVEVKIGVRLLAKSLRTLRVIETASPPTYYIPPEDVDWTELVEAKGNSFCEWKGMASYWATQECPSITVGWSYNRPKPAFFELRGYVAFYPGRIDCFLDGEKVRPQPGQFYGGWITDNLAGPFKGEEGSQHW